MKYLLMMAICFAVACGGAKSETTEDKPVKETMEKTEPTEGNETAAEDILPNDGTRQVGDVTTCLVTGDVFTVAADSPAVEHEGGTYYMCCAGCIDKFKADPAKYLAGGVEPKPKADAADAQPNDGTRKVGDVTTCPVSGHVFTINAKSPVVEHDGGTYYLCCGGCVDKFKADPAKYLAGK